MEKYPEKTWMSPKIEVRDSSVGKGMFAKEPIEEGEVLVIWGGNTCNTETARQWERNGKIVMEWDDDLWTYEDKGEDDSYFINHSCDPNLWMQGISTLVTRRPIQKDEELTADYALWEDDENHVAPWECKCKSPLCRHKITGKDYLLPELQERYKGHFSKLINNRIKKLKNDF